MASSENLKLEELMKAIAWLDEYIENVEQKRPVDPEALHKMLKRIAADVHNVRIRLRHSM